MATPHHSKMSKSVAEYLLEKLADAVDLDLRIRRSPETDGQRVAVNGVHEVYAEVRVAQGRV